MKIVKLGMLGAIVICLFSVFPAIFAWNHLSRQAEGLLPFEVTYEDSRLTGNILWVDARSQAEYEQEHAYGAILLNENEWDTHLGALFENWAPEKVIVVYCGARCQASHKIAEKIRELGMEPVWVLRGGLPAWRKFHALRKQTSNL